MAINLRLIEILQQGRPLNIQTFGNVDMNKLYNHCTPERHWQTVLVNAESVSHLEGQRHFRTPTAKCTTIQLLREVLPATSRREGKEIDGALCIIDLQGFGYGAVLTFPKSSLIIQLFRLGKFWQMKSLIRNSFQVSQDYYPESYVLLSHIYAL